jgi:hypothetical protein
VVEIESGALILSAGAGNERLVQDLRSSGIAFDPDESRQQKVNAYMLVLRSLRGTMDPMAGSFHDLGGMFLASRVDEVGRTVLLIGDGQRRLAEPAGGMASLSAGSWFRELEPSLKQLMPHVIQNPELFDWGFYEGPKTEPWAASGKYPDGGAPPKNYYWIKHQDMNAWLAWPSYLTFAPLVAAQILESIQKSLAKKPVANWTAWEGFRMPVEPLEERWRSCGLLDWSGFQALL